MNELNLEKIGSNEEDQIRSSAETPINLLANKVIEHAKTSGAKTEELNILQKYLEGYAKFLGEQAVAEQNAEKEMDLVEKFLVRVEKIIKTLQEKGLNDDAEKITKAEKRLILQANNVMGERDNLEQSWGRRLGNKDIENFSSDNRFRIHAQVAWQKGESGGYVLTPDGKFGSFFRNQEDLEKMSADYRPEGSEYINYYLSKEGELELFRQLGIIGPNEDLLDVPDKYFQGQSRPWEYGFEFPTGMEGVELFVKKERAADGEKQIAFRFDNKYAALLLARRKLYKPDKPI